MATSSQTDQGLQLPRYPNLLQMVVVPVATPTADQREGHLILQRPRGRTALGRRFFDLIGASPYVRVVLDGYGEVVWRLLDGKRTVAQVAEGLRKSEGETVELLQPRLATFLMQLEDRGLVRILPGPTETVAPASHDSDEDSS